MFKTFRSFYRAFFPLPVASKLERAAGEKCLTCVYFSYCDPDDVGESDGYCGVAFAFDPNAEYGSWVSSQDWCKYYEACPLEESMEREHERQQALDKARSVDAVGQ